MKTWLNPTSLPRNPAFSQGVRVETPATLIYVGGQNATDADGNVVGDDLATQTATALDNLAAVLGDAAATLHDVVHWTVAVVDGQPLEAGLQAFTERWGDGAEPPAITVHVVAALAHPDFLVEIDAVAAT